MLCRRRRRREECLQGCTSRDTARHMHCAIRFGLALCRAEELQGTLRGCAGHREGGLRRSASGPFPTARHSCR